MSQPLVGDLLLSPAEDRHVQRWESGATALGEVIIRFFE